MEIKKDKAYQKILSILKNQITDGNLEGQIIFGDEKRGFRIDFEESDLSTSLHGIKKMEFKIFENKKVFDVNMKLFDVYDFDPTAYAAVLACYSYGRCIGGGGNFKKL